MKIRTLTKKFTAIVVAIAVLVSCMVVSLTTIASSAEWDGMAAQDFAEGTGTVSDPFLVSTPSELKLAVTSTGLNSEGGQYHYKMTNNIYLNEVLSEGWTENQPNEWAVSTLNDDAKTAAFKGVFDGDVYIASGQSNMEFRLQSTEQTGTVEGNSLLRFRNRGTNTWNAFTAENVEAVSGIGVLFAQELGNALDNSIPIGIVCTAVGASRVEDWIHSDYCFCEEYEFETLAHSDYSYYDQGHHDLYTKHILPIEKMTTAGVLWYQGESNRGIGEAYRYLDMFEVFVDSWRTRMDDPTLPFYTVQIMLYTGDTGKDRNGNAVDEYNIRIAQGEAARTIEGVTVCTMLSREDTKKADGGWDIHPTDKLPVAKGLANAALTTYYYPQGDYDKTPEYSGPLYKEITVNEGTATITFNHVAEGLMLTSGDTVTELEVRDSEGNWVAATGNLSNNTVTVTADGVTEITGVRMGYRNSPDINLFSTINGVYGYCASPFMWTSK